MTATNMPRGDLRYLIGAATLVVVIGALALTFGIVRFPAVDGMTADAAPSLSIAWTEFNDREGCTDLMVARPDGEVDSVVCHPELERVLGWTEDGIVTLSFGERGDRKDIRDAETGKVLSSSRFTGYDELWREEEEGGGDTGFSVERKGGDLVLLSPSGVPVWQVEADARYEIDSIEGSPDGEWVALADSAGRLLVVPSDGSAAPVVWATGIGEWSWMDLVWEGSEPPV